MALLQLNDGDRASRPIAYAAFVVDADACTIEPDIGGLPLQVSGQAIATFVCLYNQLGQIVSRETILASWPSQYASTNDALTHAVHELREALADSSRRPRYIRTARNKGYQLLAPTSPASAHTNRNHEAVQWLTFASVSWVFGLVAVPSGWMSQVLFPYFGWSKFRSVCLMLTLTISFVFAYSTVVFVLWRRIPDFGVPPIVERLLRSVERRLWSCIVAVIAVVATPLSLALFVSAPPISTPPVSPPPAPLCALCIAVMPFAYESSDPSYAYLGNGLPYELVAVLSKLPPIQPISYSVTSDISLAHMDFSTSAQHLQAAHIVEGRITMERGEIRVTVTLVDASTGHAVWSHAYQYRLASVLELYDTVATQVAKELQVAISPVTRASIADMASSSSDVNTLYLQGRSILGQPTDGDALRQASSLFLNAIAGDPHFGRAYAGLCETRVAQYRTSRDSAFIEQANDSCNQALTLDASAQEVQLARGRLYTETGDYTRADEVFRAALQINPTFYEAHLRLGDLRVRQQRYDDAKMEYEAAIALQPGNWMAYAAEGLLLCEHVHDFTLGQKRLEHVVSLRPESAKALNNLGTCHWFQGELEDALSAFMGSNNLASSASTLSNIGAIDILLGRYDDAVTTLEAAVALEPNDHRLSGNLAIAQSYSNTNRDTAPDTYRTAIHLAAERLATDPSDTDALGDVATYYAAVGDRESALKNLQQALSQAPEDAEILYLAACTYALLSMTESAAASACASIERGKPIRNLESDPRLSAAIASNDYQSCRIHPSADTKVLQH